MSSFVKFHKLHISIFSLYLVPYFSHFFLFSVIPSILGVYLAEVINFSIDIKAEYPESPIGEIVPFAMANVFSPEFNYLIYIIISCALVIISAVVLFYKSREMMKY